MTNSSIFAQEECYEDENLHHLGDNVWNLFSSRNDEDKHAELALQIIVNTADLADIHQCIEKTAPGQGIAIRIQTLGREGRARVFFSIANIDVDSWIRSIIGTVPRGEFGRLCRIDFGQIQK